MIFKSEIRNEDNKKLTQQIAFAELKAAVFQLENEKSPGIDEIPIKF